ncbi:hypothetical protein OZ429_14470 [Xanthomonas fragariae]|nr:hypothetical protein [Xanthomonas fragariae]WAT14239.1 hypothetical protein OZ429_14470 [Xanthomonas fragariae]
MNSIRKLKRMNVALAACASHCTASWVLLKENIDAVPMVDSPAAGSGGVSLQP